MYAFEEEPVCLNLVDVVGGGALGRLRAISKCLDNQKVTHKGSVVRL
jgi:hypothetical protein